MSRVLLCTRGGAPELPEIAGALRDRNVEPVVLDSSLYPDGVPVTLAYGGAGFEGRWAGTGSIAAGPRDRPPPSDTLRDISAVWQSVVVGTALPAMAPGMRETCVAASELAVVGLLESLQVFQLDPHGSQARAGNKPHQLRIAQRLGLEIPETIISNDPEAVRELAARCGPLITKMLVQPASTGPALDGEAQVVFTTAMTAADLAQLDGLELCPMIFQEQIENQRDVRVTVVGRRVFAAALDAAVRGGGDLDWRRESYALDRAPTWVPVELPPGLTERLLALLDHFGLNYGAVDLVVRPDGRHVFLELNASGAFAFLGAGLAAPITAAIAEVLVDPAARRVPPGPSRR